MMRRSNSCCRQIQRNTTSADIVVNGSMHPGRYDQDKQTSEGESVRGKVILVLQSRWSVCVRISSAAIVALNMFFPPKSTE